MGEHAGLMLADSIPAYIATRTYGCEMVVLSGFTPSMSVVTLYPDTAGLDTVGNITGQTCIESLILLANQITSKTAIPWEDGRFILCSYFIESEKSL
ncbi:hypothetical protein HPY31_25760 [Brevibacillus sp. HB1.3]|uniref:hypothetical protein n=1 Tax=Brevibacillus sp. HB1.3 TaxID=2738842 RepID=UPI0015553ECE|nr:hypothetical protein [Brevibacillus sp. HB1.3]NQF17285.1 hypothetical protein [Brevibacillus sp. HB1.3]